MLEWIALNMRASGLSGAFVQDVLALARESDGVADMMYLWEEDVSLRGEAVKAMRSSLEDRMPVSTRRSELQPSSG